MPKRTRRKLKIRKRKTFKRSVGGMDLFGRKKKREAQAREAEERKQAQAREAEAEAQELNDYKILGENKRDEAYKANELRDRIKKIKDIKNSTNQTYVEINNNLKNDMEKFYRENVNESSDGNDVKLTPLNIRYKWLDTYYKNDDWNYPITGYRYAYDDKYEAMKRSKLLWPITTSEFNTIDSNDEKKEDPFLWPHEEEEEYIKEENDRKMRQGGPIVYDIGSSGEEEKEEEERERQKERKKKEEEKEKEKEEDEDEDLSVGGRKRKSRKRRYRKKRSFRKTKQKK